MPTAQSPKTSVLAIVSMVLGILSFVSMGLTSLPAAVVGHMAISRIKRGAGALKGKGQAAAGLACGYLGLAFFSLVLLSIPAVMRAQQASERVGVIYSMKSLSLVMLEFDHEYGSYPSDETADVVAESTGSDLPMTGSSTLNQLTSMVDEEVLNELLSVPCSAEGDWLYFTQLNSNANLETPLLISPELDGGWRVVLRVDCSAKALKRADYESYLSNPSVIRIPARRR